MGSLVFIKTNDTEFYFESRNANERRMKAVVQVDANGNIINTFPSIAAAQRATGIYHISECINRQRATAGGFYWFLQGDY